MDLTKLVAQPQLIKLALDDEETIAEFHEPLEFYIWDRQPLDVFLRLSNSLGTDQETSVSILKTLILDAEAKPVVAEGQALPVKIMIKAMAKVMDQLGK